MLTAIKKLIAIKNIIALKNLAISCVLIAVCGKPEMTNNL